jgi:hypothetical protein
MGFENSGQESIQVSGFLVREARTSMVVDGYRSCFAPQTKEPPQRGAVVVR